MLLGFLSPIMVIAWKYCQSDSLLNLYLSTRFGFREHYCPIPSEGNVCTERLSISENSPCLIFLTEIHIIAYDSAASNA